VVAVEDWMAVVTKAPEKMPVTRLVVMVPNTLRNPPPVSFCKASLMVFIPYINRARHPNRVKKVKKVILVFYCITNQDSIVISPRNEPCISRRTSALSSNCPNRYISLVTAASVVRSRPLMIPISANFLPVR